MLFEVFGRDKKRLFYTESEKCIPKDSELAVMQKAGYTFKRDGKVISRRANIEAQKQTKQAANIRQKGFL